ASDTATVGGWTVNGEIWLGQATRTDGGDTSSSAINYIEKVIGSATGINTVTFADSNEGVTIDLDLQTVTNSGTAVGYLENFTHATGSAYDDRFVMQDDNDNSMTGGAGNDVFVVKDYTML
ncbi:MAG: hypothetical protein WC722_10570, partial [Rhodospirillales bacterium]